MNWDAIGVIVEIIGVTAVLITLLYLSTQIKQTNDISRFSTFKEIQHSFDNLNQMVVTDLSLRNVLHKTTDLSSEENEQLYTFVNMFCNTWTICQAAYDNGLIDGSIFEASKKDVLFEIERWPNFRQSVKLWLERYPEFKEFDIFLPLKETN